MKRASGDNDRRRSSLGGMPGPSRLENMLDPNHAAILFRDSRGVSVMSYLT